jgi:hypothetical protein
MSRKSPKSSCQVERNELFSIDESGRQFGLFDHEVDRDTLSNEPNAAGSLPDPVIPAGKYSNFIVYVDESGDPWMGSLDPNYPLFVLAFCTFYKRHYCESVAPALQKFKFNHFGHDLITLHERDIRKEIGAFKFSAASHKNSFIGDLTDIIERSNFILMSCVVDKNRLKERPNIPQNPYNIALGFCLETLYEFVVEKKQSDKITHIVVECRGKREDRELELEFRRICDGNNKMGIRLPFEIIFADKRTNSTGLQLADLVARPIGMSILRSGHQNRAFDVLRKKFFCSGGRAEVGVGYENWGLKMFPGPESEKPR